MMIIVEIYGIKITLIINFCGGQLYILGGFFQAYVTVIIF